MRLVLTKNLGLGWEVQEAASAEEGLDLLLGGGKKFDIAVFDENFGDLGELSGSDAIRRCREAGPPRPAFHLVHTPFLSD